LFYSRFKRRPKSSLEDSLARLKLATCEAALTSAMKAEPLVKAKTRFPGKTKAELAMVKRTASRRLARCEGQRPSDLVI
jgi:hypothetical protein